MRSGTNVTISHILEETPDRRWRWQPAGLCSSTTAGHWALDVVLMLSSAHVQACPQQGSLGHLETHLRGSSSPSAPSRVPHHHYHHRSVRNVDELNTNRPNPSGDFTAAPSPSRQQSSVEQLLFIQSLSILDSFSQQKRSLIDLSVALLTGWRLVGSDRALLWMDVYPGATQGTESAVIGFITAKCNIVK